MIIVTFVKQTSGLGAIGSKRKADEIEEDADDDGVGGWIYVGSHNFSPSAWVRTWVNLLTIRGPSTSRIPRRL